MQSNLLATMRSCLLALSVPLAVLVFSISNTQASVTFKFEGKLTSVDNALSGTFSVGDKFTGTYTFDETSVDPFYNDTDFAEFENSISAMSFTTKKYRVSSAATGGIGHDFQDDFEYFASISPLAGDSIGNYALYSMYVDWVADHELAAPEGLTASRPLARPFFNPDLPAWLILSDGTYYDADGNLVYAGVDAPAGLFGLIGNPDTDQPLFFEDGSPALSNNRNFFLDFSDGQTFAGIRGDFSSVTVVPIPTAVWLFGSGLLGLIGMAKRKQIS
jgi:hypothetical protein